MLRNMDYESWPTGFDVSRETFEKLEAYHRLLLKWQKSINLISPNTINDVWHRHILDSAQFIKHIDGRASTIVDIGSGAGLPALILSIMGINIHLIESDQRKCIFLKEVSRALQLDTTIHNERIEKCAIDSVDIITARACASLDTLLDLTRTLRIEKTICLFAKGKNYDKEIEDAKKTWSFDFIAHQSVTDDQATILELSHITS